VSPLIYVVDSGSLKVNGSVYVIDTKSKNTINKNISIAGVPPFVFVDPYSKLFCVADLPVVDLDTRYTPDVNSTVSVIDSDTGAVKVVENPRFIFKDSDRPYIYVANSNPNTLSVFGGSPENIIGISPRPKHTSSGKILLVQFRIPKAKS
jgi:DNA-binding beta-propeller fold protein YncE